MSRGQGQSDRKVAADSAAPVAFLTVAVTHEQAQTAGCIVNIAEGALFLATEVRVLPGCWVGVRIVVDGEPCDARGKVVWQADNGLGIRLTRVHDRFREFVRKLAAAGADGSKLLESVDDAGVMIGG